MTAINFKSKLKTIKDFLLGKEIIMSIVTTDGVEKLNFKTLKAFGNKVLELEKLGAGFSISKVGNALVQRRALTEKELTKCINSGAWTSIYVTASTL